MRGVAEDGLAAAHREWVGEALHDGRMQRHGSWSETVAVGSEGFVQRVREESGDSGRHRAIDEIGGAWVLRNPPGAWLA